LHGNVFLIKLQAVGELKNGNFPVSFCPWFFIFNKTTLPLKIALAFYVVWLMTVIIFQFSEPLRKRLDPLHFYLCGLLPAWHLFSPRPTDGDYGLYYRTSAQEKGDFSDWKEVGYIRRKVFLHVLFNPNGNIVKATQEICQYASQSMTERNVYYRLLLRDITGRARRGKEAPVAEHRFIQFRISWKTPASQNNLFFSNVHEF